MNIICIAGNITRDAETRFLPNGDPVASFAVADNQGKDKAAIFWNCSLFGKRAESLAPYLLRGNAVTVTGTVTEREYVNKDGHKVKAQDIRVNDVALQGGRREESAAPAPSQRAKPAPKAKDDPDFMDDIPF